jgi:excisionase family DNA binding protein
MTTTTAPISTSSPTHAAGDDRLVFTVAEAGELLGISRAFAYELVARGELPVIKLGRRRLVPKVALLALIGGDGSPLAGDPGSATDADDGA